MEKKCECHNSWPDLFIRRTISDDMKLLQRNWTLETRPIYSQRPNELETAGRKRVAAGPLVADITAIDQN